MGHTMEQQWGIPWSSNGAHHGAVIGHIMEHAMEQQWAMLWSNNRAYYRAATGIL